MADYPVQLSTCGCPQEWNLFDEWRELPFGAWDALYSHEERILECYENAITSRTVRSAFAAGCTRTPSTLDLL